MDLNSVHVSSNNISAKTEKISILNPSLESTSIKWLVMQLKDVNGKGWQNTKIDTLHPDHKNIARSILIIKEWF